MLILPIVNKNRVLNVRIKLKGTEKIRSAIKFPGAPESDVIVNGKKLSESSSFDSREKNATINFIRNNSILYARNFLVTTRMVADSDVYDVYEVGQPPRKVNDALEELYDLAITDIRKEIPGIKRGRYLSFKKIGLDEALTDEKIQMLERIVNDVKDSSQWPGLFEKAGISDLPRILEFLNNFDCTVVEHTSIKEEDIEHMINTLEPLCTRETRNLISYYNTAMVNRDIYGKLSYINKLLYGRPLSLIQSNAQRQKQLVKTTDGEVEYSRNAA